MNAYCWDDIKVGLKETFSVTVTKEMQDLFLKISGDVNPCHINREYAIGRGFKDILVYGGVTVSFYSRLVGVYLPGKHCLFQELNAGFNKPVYIGDTLTVLGTVIDKNEDFHRITIKAVIRNQDNEKVSSAKIIVGCQED